MNKMEFCNQTFGALAPAAGQEPEGESHTAPSLHLSLLVKNELWKFFRDNELSHKFCLPTQESVQATN